MNNNNEIKRLPVPGWLPPAGELAQLCGVSVRTARRWRQASETIPTPARRALAAADGDLGAIWGEAWAGWRAWRGGLYAPGDPRPYTPADLLALHYEAQRAAALARQVQELKQQARTFPAITRARAHRRRRAPR